MAAFDPDELHLARRFALLALPRRNVANLLSLVNLACGALAIAFAVHEAFALALLASLVGAAFDGVDGAVARRLGSTRIGVLADDTADAVNFAFAPAVALAVGLGGTEGLAIGVAYGLFTLGRLVYFTLRKEACDPAYFDGAPSTIGSVIVLSSLSIFPEHPAVIGVLAGVALAQMVSFQTAYRHLGRWLARHRPALLFLPPVALALLLAGVRLGPEVPAAVLLVASVGYGFQPMVRAFQRALAGRGPSPDRTVTPP
ncbi:MAG: CDP-alcohol phosphatidyltransferase family protein [Deltaproteobacteria bacterium]|nr:CDP-alcohol phosphatidyltransferase family protein [Deltaproteobacteria bacterium]